MYSVYKNDHYQLTMAIRRKDLSEVQSLVERGADINIVWNLRHPTKDEIIYADALTHAVYLYCLPIMQYLTSLPQMNSTARGSYALGSAAEIGFVAGVKHLLTVPGIIQNDYALSTAARLKQSKCNPDDFQQIMDLLASQPFYNPFSRENKARKEEIINFLKARGLQDHISRHFVEEFGWSQNKYLFFNAHSTLSILPKEIRMEMAHNGFLLAEQEKIGDGVSCTG